MEKTINAVYSRLFPGHLAPAKYVSCWVYISQVLPLCIQPPKLLPEGLVCTWVVSWHDEIPGSTRDPPQSAQKRWAVDPWWTSGRPSRRAHAFFNIHARVPADSLCYWKSPWQWSNLDVSCPNGTVKLPTNNQDQLYWMQIFVECRYTYTAYIPQYMVSPSSSEHLFLVSHQLPKRAKWVGQSQRVW